jgi:hypothetical protein
MKYVSNGVGSFLTGSDIADAVLAYGLALSRLRMRDIVDIPFVDTSGIRRRAQFVVGWVTDLTVTTSGWASDELIEPETAGALRSKTAGVETPETVPFTRPGQTFIDDLDW